MSRKAGLSRYMRRGISVAPVECPFCRKRIDQTYKTVQMKFKGKRKNLHPACALKAQTEGERADE